MQRTKLSEKKILTLRLSQFGRLQDPTIGDVILRGIASFSFYLLQPIKKEHPKAFAQRLCLIPNEQKHQLEIEYSRRVGECALNRITVENVIRGWYDNVEFYKIHEDSSFRFVKVSIAEVLLNGLKHLQFPDIEISRLSTSIDELRRIDELERTLRDFEIRNSP